MVQERLLGQRQRVATFDLSGDDTAHAAHVPASAEALLKEALTGRDVLIALAAGCGVFVSHEGSQVSGGSGVGGLKHARLASWGEGESQPLPPLA